RNGRLPGSGRPAGSRQAPSVDRVGDSRCHQPGAPPVMGTPTPVLGYYWGDDDYGLERAAEKLAERMEREAGAPVERWRVRGDATTTADVAERVGTAPFFGGGTLVVVSGPAALARSKSERPTLLDVVASLAPGNGLAFIETVDSFGRRSVAGADLAQAVAAAGGEVREVRAPREGQMVRWIEQRAAERGIRFGR